ILPQAGRQRLPRKNRKCVRVRSPLGDLDRLPEGEGEGCASNAAHEVCNAPKKLGADAGSRRPQPRVRGGGRGVHGQTSAPVAAYARIQPGRQRSCKKKAIFLATSTSAIVVFLE